jgi:nitrite reductase (NADH) large subunit
MAKEETMVRNPEREEYLIIGAGAAGMAAAATIRQHNSAANITVLSAESDRPYYRPMIPFLISGQKKAAEIFIEDNGPFTSQGIKILLQAKATTIDTQRRVVLLESGREFVYDKLLIATGSSPVFPDSLQAQTAEGVYTLRTLAEACSIARRSQNAKNVVMLGGGMLNVKTAFALLARGLNVTMVEIEESVLPWLMEADATPLIHNALLKAGLKVITGCTLSSLHFEKNNHDIKRVKLSNGQELDCQMLLIGIGVQPNISLLGSTPLKLNQGVVIDSSCRCSEKNIFAAGDVAVSIDPISGSALKTGLWTHAVEMGRCAGKNMVGLSSEYAGPYGILNATQVANVPFVSIGTVHTANTDYETYVFKTTQSYRKLIFSLEGDRLIGALFVGDITGSGLYRHLIRERIPVTEIKSHILRHRLHYGHLLSRVA